MSTPNLSVSVSHRDLRTVIEVDNNIPVRLLAEALASRGLILRSKNGVLYLGLAAQDWQLDLGENGNVTGRCPSCKSVEVTSSQRHAELGLYGHMVCQVCGHTSEAKS